MLGLVFTVTVPLVIEVGGLTQYTVRSEQSGMDTFLHIRTASVPDALAGVGQVYPYWPPVTSQILKCSPKLPLMAA